MPDDRCAVRVCRAERAAARADAAGPAGEPEHPAALYRSAGAVPADLRADHDQPGDRVLLASGALWICVNLDPSINLPNWLDGQRWFFDPFAWQFLFVIGALGALLLRRYDGNLPAPAVAADCVPGPISALR